MPGLMSEDRDRLARGRPGRAVRVVDSVEAVTHVWCQPHPAASDLCEPVSVLDVPDMTAADVADHLGRVAGDPRRLAVEECDRRRACRPRKVLPSGVELVEEEDTGEEH